MKLQAFNFEPHPILVDNRLLHAVMVGRDDVSSIELFEGVLIVARGSKVWFTHTSYGTGMPIEETEEPIYGAPPEPRMRKAKR